MVYGLTFNGFWLKLSLVKIFSFHARTNIIYTQRKFTITILTFSKTPGERLALIFPDYCTLKGSSNLVTRTNQWIFNEIAISSFVFQFPLRGRHPLLRGAVFNQTLRIHNNEKIHPESIYKKCGRLNLRLIKKKYFTQLSHNWIPCGFSCLVRIRYVKDNR